MKKVIVSEGVKDRYGGIEEVNSAEDIHIKDEDKGKVSVEEKDDRILIRETVYG